MIDIDKNTISTGLYDHLCTKWYEEFIVACGNLKLSDEEKRQAAFYAGMRAAQQLIENSKYDSESVGT